MLAVDPRAFRDVDGYENDLDAVIDVLHTRQRCCAGQASLRAKRMVEGIPMPGNLVQHVRDVAAARAGVDYMLGRRADAPARRGNKST